MVIYEMVEKDLQMLSYMGSSWAIVNKVVFSHFIPNEAI
jgi:hypothetical protein